MRTEFQSIGQVTKKFSKTNWNRFREISREINREKNQFYKSQKVEQKKNIDFKKALITEVKEILENDDWRSFSNRMKNIQKDWRSIGFVQKKLSKTLWEEFRSQCNLYFDRIKSGYNRINKNEIEAHKKKEAFLKSVVGFKMPPELEPFKEFFNYQWEEYSQLGQLSGITNSKSIEDFNNSFIALIDKSEMEKSVKAEAKNYIHFSIIKDDENGLSREIQNIKRIIEELNSEARQLENNLEYFSNSSADNPLLMDVTSKLDRLKSEIEKYEEQLIGIRKLKREAANKNLPDQEGPTEEEGVGRKIQA
jgi:vacuolar-type H+-ATPase subunit I/STV1